MKNMVIVMAAGLMLAGCETGGLVEHYCDCRVRRVAALDAKAWDASEWISFAGAKVASGDDCGKRQCAAEGAAYFMKEYVNPKKVVKAVWMTSGLGVYEAYVNGVNVGDDFLKPGFTHVRKTRRSFTYDVTALVKKGANETNAFAAAVSSGWWRDKIVNYAGKRSAFRGVIEFTYADGTKELKGTKAGDWLAKGFGSVKNASIFEGEVWDEGSAYPPRISYYFTGAKSSDCVRNDEFKGEILPSEGGEICLRHDLAMQPVGAYAWEGVEGASGTGDKAVYGKVKKVRTFKKGEHLVVKPGETLVVDFGQNCAAVPRFLFRAKKRTTMTALPGEMLNDGNGERSRGNDGPAGSVYRENLRMPETGMHIVYTFPQRGDKVYWSDGRVTDYSETPFYESYMPRFTFFGYRYLSITATDEVEIERIVSIPVTSIAKEMELGKIETGEKDVNRLIANVYWGQLSNYLSVPTDCPQRNERLGWMADTQVFAEAGAFNADTAGFFHKWTRDVRDSVDVEGGYPSVAPFAQYGNDCWKLGWADAGVIVPWTVWKMFGDTAILKENFDAMAKFVRKLDATKYDLEPRIGYNYADWLSYETFETHGNAFGDWNKWKDDPDAMNYRRYLAACYWLYDARLMVQMAEALGRAEDAAWFRGSADRALAYIRGKFLEADGLLLKPMRNLQTACVFALHFGVVEGKAKDATLAFLKRNIREHGDCLQTGFLGTSFLMDALSECGETELCYTLLLQHKHPSWLYSVDQGATTIWERWNSYTKEKGFGPVGMNSFNHYAYGQVLGWMYRTIAGIAADPANPGFRNIIMKPIPDQRLGFVKAEYRSRAGLITSAWRYEGEKWIWDFTIPEGATASVTLPGEKAAKPYVAGTYRIER